MSCFDLQSPLTLKTSITTAADDIHKYIFIVFSEKIRLDVSSESSDSLKNQALFSSKEKSKKLKCRILQFLFGALRVKYCLVISDSMLSQMEKFKTAHTFSCCTWNSCTKQRMKSGNEKKGLIKY